MNALATSPNVAGHPDASYIRHSVPIEEVAERLGLEVHNHFARCFRPDSHKNGDANPSLHFHRNRARCFKCDQHDFSNLDLVMGVRGCDFSTAIQWMCGYFLVPNVKPGRPVGTKIEQRPYRVGVHGGEFETLVRSGVYAGLCDSACRILEVLRSLRNDDGEIGISYPELGCYAGISSKSTISRGLRELEQKHIIRTSKRRHVGAIKEQNVYRLTLDHPKLRELMSQTFESRRPEISRERVYRAQVRKQRRRVLLSLHN